MTESHASAPVLSERFDLAYLMASSHHRTQLRRGTEVPYVSHLLAVASIVLEMGGTEDEAIGALLHDYVEDGGGPAGLERIRRAFGNDVARIVEANTDTDEEPKPPWRERKEAYIAAIAAKRPDELRVSLADKLHNARAILLDYRTHGEALWSRFKPGEGPAVRWYYEALADAFAERRDALGPGATPALDELQRVVETLRGLAGAGEAPPPAPDPEPVPAGRAEKGSRLQLQRAVEENRGTLDVAIRGAFEDLAGAELEWRSPLAEDGYREYRDMEFLMRIGRPDLGTALAAFWPRPGPFWDGLAVVRRPERSDGVLLVEAKAHPDEIEKGTGSAARAPDSTAAIMSALAWLAADLGVLDANLEGWMRGPGYQHVNRVAYARWLNEQGLDTWLVHVLFAHDRTHRPSEPAELEAAMARVTDELRLSGIAIPRVGHVVVDALG
ncbi:MAG TPA: HD domain-containing protein [Solirubrobacteraceae bacterium]|nr:HD domain-containing protein [Solirubrobacteraceae bacterium]